MRLKSGSFDDEGRVYAGITMERLHAFNQRLPNGARSFDLDACTLTTGGTTISMQVIGTFSAERATWVWAWADENLPQFPDAIVAAEDLRAYGERYGYEALTSPNVDLSEFGDADRAAEMLAFIAIAVLDARGYVSVPTGDVRTYLVSHDPALPERGPREPEDVYHYLRSAAERFPDVDQMELAAGYVDAVGGRYQQVPGGLVINLGEGSMTLFYRDGKLISIGLPVAFP